ncbi:hypothetical protein KRR26_13230 [Corallococcus sp. M34]|uniref:hypothetical protein n=1 Tax=Citreicoccus inhibens TaxID=2849499 RepID=UPI001C24E7D7|nr:hypothetical protein [Citreicoccus inhibens]MBU8896576.1 hypothetical protein [Citreicoccus inhibens]
MKSSSKDARATSSSAGLRWVHAIIFLGLAALVFGAAIPEWQYLGEVVGWPYHTGEPPRGVLLVGSVLAAVGVLRLGVALVRSVSAPLWASVCILLGVLATMLTGSWGPPLERSERAANLSILSSARRVHLRWVGVLQEEGEVPARPEPWVESLGAVTQSGSRVSNRFFRPVSPRLVWLTAPDARPTPLVPGDVWVFVSPDGISFEVRAVGVEAGQPVFLHDETGAPVVLRGLFNPDLPPTQPREP